MTNKRLNKIDHAMNALDVEQIGTHEYRKVWHHYRRFLSTGSDYSLFFVRNYLQWLNGEDY